MSNCRCFASIVISLLLQKSIIQGSEIKSLVNRNDLSLISINPSNLLAYHNNCHDIFVRGGSSSDTDEEETDDEEENENNSLDDNVTQLSNNVESLKDALTATTKLLGKIALFSYQAFSRAVQAAMVSLKNDDNKGSNTIFKVTSILQEMWKAAFPPIPLNDENSSTTTTKDSSKSVDKDIRSTSIESTDENESITFDFGKYLSNTYEIDDNRHENASPILSGPISDALVYARTNARLLVAYIPAKGPQGKSKVTSDNTAIHSLLSSEVSEVTDKRSRKNTATGSFYIWGAKAGSPEAVVATKRLKIKTVKGKQTPTLVVSYPAIAMGPSGVPKIVPKVLAQHHCSPPPSAEVMSAWLTTLRKRHSKQYAAMLHDLREAQLLRERQEGYKSSIISDKQRQEEEERLEAERLVQEKAEQERMIAIEKRRMELKASLPDEIDIETSTSATIVLIALRFADGRTGQRRFESSTTLSTVFNWIDAYFEIERERVTLTTMNGKQSFSWDKDGSSTLIDEGFRRNAAFRVMETTVSKSTNVTKVE